MRVLNVAEKPSMARQLSFFLAGGDVDSTNGKNKYCRNFTFAQEFRGSHVTMVMTSVLGHVKGLDFEPGYEDWQRVPIGSLFHAPIVSEISKDMLDVAENLCAEARKCQVLVIWTDCDREGEYIGSEIAQICSQANPRIEIFRARYSALTTAELNRSLRNIARLDERQIAAAELRSELDLRAGAAFTRLQTTQLRSKFPGLAGKIISYGSCQFPTLGFVVEQYFKVVSFIPEPFWSISMEVSQDSTVTKFNWKRSRLFDRQVASILYERCVRLGQARLTRIESKETTKWRPLPLRTVELQKLGSKFLKLSSDKLMTIAEKLYNQGYISYPRTETDMFEDDFVLQPLISKQTKNPKWGKYAEGLLNGKFRRPRRGKNNDKAHPPIHPTKAGADLGGQEAKLYEFIARRFLACCSEDAKGFETVAWAEIGEEAFRARGIMVKELNYLEVYVYENWNDQAIGRFSPGQVLIPSRLELTSGTTTAPKLLSEPELIGSMDKNGIGTDATIHEHIKKIIDRAYVIKNGESRFHPTNLGVALVLGYDRMGLEESLTRPKLRAQLESSLKDICENRKQKAEVHSVVINYFAESFSKTVTNFQILQASLEEYHIYGLFEPAPLGNSSPREDVDRRRSTRASNSRDQFNHSDSDDGGDGDFAPSRAVRSDNVASIGDSAGEPGPFCSCGKPSTRQITRKAGPNQGRAFWFCGVCKFFEWCDNSKPSEDQLPSLTRRATDGINERSITCHCGLNAVEKTVSKEGSNKGRKFKVCSKPKENACSFFEWSDEALAKPPQYALSGGRAIGQFNHEVKCNCEMMAVRGETKSGANAGRIYYKCPKTIRKCGFFQWDDEGGPSPATTNDSSSASCYRCGEKGHFANSCSKGFTDTKASLTSRRAGSTSLGRGRSSSSRGRGVKRQRGASRRTSTADYDE